MSRAVLVVRNVALTVGAALGCVVLVAMVAGAAFGVRAVVITSGSMSPDIGTGALVLVRDVPAADVEVGDVVTVPTPTGSRVTHRVVAIDRADDGYELTLRGDANPVSDPAPYAVSSAGLVLVDLPVVGYVLAAMRTPAGLLVAGALGAVLLGFAVTGRRGRGPGPRGGGGRHRAGPAEVPTRVPVTAGAAAVLSVAALATSPSSAAWSDPVEAGGTTLTAHTVVPPASSTCSSLLLAATVSWPEVDDRYDYEVVLRRVSTGTVVSTRSVTGTDTSVTYTGLTDFGLVVGAGTVDFSVEIRSYLTSTPSWQSADIRTYTYIQVVAILVGATATCTT